MSFLDQIKCQTRQNVSQLPYDSKAKIQMASYFTARLIGIEKKPTVVKNSQWPVGDFLQLDLLTSTECCLQTEIVPTLTQ